MILVAQVPLTDTPSPIQVPFLSYTSSSREEVASSSAADDGFTTVVSKLKKDGGH